MICDAYHLQDVILARNNDEEKGVARLLYHLNDLRVRSACHRLPIHADQSVANVQTRQHCRASVFHRFDENSVKQKRLRKTKREDMQL